MTETTSTTSLSGVDLDVAHPAHNPFDLPRPKRRNGIIVAILFAVVLHGIMGYYLYQWKFHTKFQSYSDEKTDVSILHPPPPPPVVAAPVEKPPPRPTVITNPDWLHRPSGEDVAQYYPDRAQRMGVNGTATIGCEVTESGTLTGCSVESEEPSGQEFGSAALKMAHLFKMRPQTRDGAPVGGARITIPIRFVAPKDEG